ncbi:TPA: hypothetical protein ACW7X5_003007 [Elizabethkingia meningoseptica]
MRKIQNKIENEEAWNLFKTKISNHTEKLNDKINSDRQKILEICHIGKMLTTFFPDFEIIELREKPDFIISNKKEYYGIEHQIVVDFKEKEKEGFYKNICDKAAIIISKDTGIPNFLINIYLKKECPYVIRNKNQYIHDIAELTKYYILKKEIPENDYFEDVSIYFNHDRKAICPNFGGYSQKFINGTIINDFIKKKENKIKEYKSNLDIPLWLVIVIGSTGRSSYEVNEMLNISIESHFDKIFIFEDFNNQLFEIK